jgi:hypothetical protein
MVTIDNYGNIVSCDCSWATYCLGNEGIFCMECPLTKIVGKGKNGSETSKTTKEL